MRRASSAKLCRVGRSDNFDFYHVSRQLCYVKTITIFYVIYVADRRCRRYEDATSSRRKSGGQSCCWMVDNDGVVASFKSAALLGMLYLIADVPN